MPYVERDGGGNITGIFRRPQPGITEEVLAEDHVEILAYTAKTDRHNTQKSELMDRLSDASRRAVMQFITAAAADAAHPEHADAADFLAWFMAATSVDVTSTRWTASVGALLAAGLITQAEHDAVLVP